MHDGKTLGAIAAATLLLCASPSGTAQQRSGGSGSLALRQVTYVVTDLEKTARFLTDVLGWEGVRGGSGERTGTAIPRVASEFFDADGVWIELRPRAAIARETSTGRTAAAGAIVELGFSTHEYDAVLASLHARGVRMRGPDDAPLGDAKAASEQRGGGRGDVERCGVPRIAYLPAELSGATRIGIVDADTAPPCGAKFPRDAGQARARGPQAPRVSHVAILVADLESAAGFYAGLLGLGRSPKVFEIDGAANPEIGGMKLDFIRTGGPWLELVAPAGPGPIMDALAHEGDGATAELVVEVDDLGTYAEYLQRKGIVLVDIDGKPFRGAQKYRVIDPFGTKIAYLPTDATQGMVIEIIERGPRDTDILHVRDAAWRP